MEIPSCPGLYVLDERGDPVAEPDTLKWAEWLEAAKKMGSLRLGDDTIGPYRVSTIFLGVDYNIGSRRRHLFETMVFDECREDVEMERYSTRAEALAGHAAMCARIRERLN